MDSNTHPLMPIDFHLPDGTIAPDQYDALRRERDHLQILVDVTNAVLSTLQVDDLVDEVANALLRYLDIHFVDLNLFDAEVTSVESHALLVHADGVRKRELAQFSLDHLPARDAVMARRAVVYDYPQMVLLAQTHRHVRDLLAEGFRALCVLPLFSDQQVLGVLMLAHTGEAPYFGVNLVLLQQIAARISLSLDNALAYQQISRLKDRLTRENLLLTEEIRNYESFDEIIGQSRVMSEVLEQVRMVADTDSSVLIQGETGTGKELIARAIHNLSPRKKRRMVTMNSAAIPAGLLESDLFGHEKGAFTGANAQRIGRFEMANQGTLFLDEIGDIPLELQPKLLRVLQEREFERLGGQKVIAVDVRVIAATSCDLPMMIAEKRYRSDLYYRLNVFPIHVPPLRARPEDIPLLTRFFVQKFARRLKRDIEHISDDTLARLTHHHWPGNVRELQNVIERAVILSRGPELNLPLSDLQPSAPARVARAPAAPEPPISLDGASESERERILRVLKEANGIVAGPKGAAARLGLKRTTLLSRMQRMGISVKSLDEQPDM